MEYTLKVYVYEDAGEFLLLNWNDEFFQKGDVDISRAKFDELSQDPQAVIVTRKRNRPRQRFHTED